MNMHAYLKIIYLQPTLFHQELEVALRKQIRNLGEGK